MLFVQVRDRSRLTVIHLSSLISQFDIDEPIIQRLRDTFDIVGSAAAVELDSIVHNFAIAVFLYNWIQM